jgi:hypothetical protein
MKRTCDGCKALLDLHIDCACKLGYPMKRKWSDKGVDCAPDEPCPKPMTNRKYVDLLLIRKDVPGRV